MGGYELIAVVVFFLVGYWLVDYFWPKKKSDQPPAPAPASAPPGDNMPWHEVLSVPPDADAERIRKAYEEKSVQYDPGRVAGTGPEYEEALRMTRKVNDAYEAAVRRKS